MVTRLNIITARDGLIMMIKSKWIRRGMENEGRITGLRFRVAFGNNYCLLKVTKTCQVCVTILVTGKSEANLANLRRLSDLQRLDGTLNWNLSHVNQTRPDQSRAALQHSPHQQVTRITLGRLITLNTQVYWQQTWQWLLGFPDTGDVISVELLVLHSSDGCRSRRSKQVVICGSWKIRML